MLDSIALRMNSFLYSVKSERYYPDLLKPILGVSLILGLCTSRVLRVLLGLL